MEHGIIDADATPISCRECALRSVTITAARFHETKPHKEPSMKKTPESRSVASVAIGFAALCAGASPERIPLDIRPRK